MSNSWIWGFWKFESKNTTFFLPAPLVKMAGNTGAPGVVWVKNKGICEPGAPVLISALKMVELMIRQDSSARRLWHLLRPNHQLHHLQRADQHWSTRLADTFVLHPNYSWRTSVPGY